MRRTAQSNIYSSMKTSPWIILGSTVILLVAVIVLAVQNTNREKRYMTKILREKGAVLIRAVEAGARTGMMGMMWGGPQIQRLLEENGRLPVERAVILMTGEHVSEKQLPMNIARERPDGGREAFAGMVPADGSRSLEDIEKEAILTTLEATEGNKSETARRLGITRKTLHNKLKSYGEG